MDITILSPGIYTYGAMLIGGVLRDAGHRVTLTRTGGAPAGSLLLASLFSTQHLLDPAIRGLIRTHRKQGGTVYIGGPVSAAPEMVLGELAPDAVVVGEGEETVVRLVEEGVSATLPGIAYRDNERVVVTPPAPPAPIDRPLPLIPDDIGSQSIRGASAYIETHRGCIGGCTFCQVPRFFGRKVRSRNLASIIDEVKVFKASGATRLSVSGGTGSLYGSRDGEMNPEAFINLLRGMAEVMGPHNVSSPDIRVDCITDEVLDAIRQYTIGWVFFGIESGSDRVLRLMGKGVAVRQVEEAVERCREHNLRVAGSFIVGYPGETKRDYEATKDLIAALSLDDVFVSSAEPIPGTPLADLAVRTPRDKNPAFMPHTGEYRALGLTESEARSFDLMMHADMFRPQVRLVTDEVYDAYLTEAKKQGQDIRAATELLLRYPRTGA
ncbi:MULTISPECIES: methyl-coenzyme M reductase glutamine C-methyltransferase [unclassified Methanoculleus]|uniref:methyl-coenzyme M reductase glutamine C-methyltransferase n=1 Tax=unclassified Methanoculleus TaxID=2619537 RepID=UPI0025CDEF38|nr:MULTISPECIES: methyl-coenzyme M reductase glutamine C-methyltransferase [unclassified Methanoculleus]MCK9318670.1 TIGR04014 family B12-binding domain/radical SAM domain-containing protein [Methanoculleus sp.]MDD2254549.1 methyl-coenzyme M reductase glutamine C-methyltransferase [Methanoculleus sp.]MDD2787113.1 methyl-coenzyme M reductase glutamine C-methyltransferase [Methanoculleus sp.]MDD3215985.1 methyl-coenzyme M reductase glutamine C-methyltransferase [Methanoculleus sp.]MDD4314092.1 m